MRGIDPRLLARARPARLLIRIDAAIGVAMALLVLAQAALLAHVVARAFDGASLADVSTPLVLLAAVVAARAALGWSFEVAGRRAAAGVLSQLRLDLVEQRLRGSRPRSTAPRARRSRPPRSPASTRSRRSSRATSPS